MLDGLKGSCCFLCMFCFFGFYTFPVTFEGCLHGHLCYKQLSVRITPEKKRIPWICWENQAGSLWQQEGFISSSDDRLCVAQQFLWSPPMSTWGPDTPKPPFLHWLWHAFHQPLWILTHDQGPGDFALWRPGTYSVQGIAIQKIPTWPIAPSHPATVMDSLA